ncbi:phage tail tape measure protein [Pseudophaeobacter flagellatus]|uniref:phage tail tape measure protein n=1 Tax=Pseudophaeobacter flagellatus TaxID=2899119 RepID=UPI001E485D0B|nr:phage tail tape measure protein [Pseudophaeobacter flagellatus]MCD9147827.1 phage tail tape measure protein [Pseudophaeobacter flagellatus]
MRKQNLSAKISIGGVLDKSFKKNVGLIRSGFENIGDSIRSVKARQKELTRQRADLRKQGKSVEALDREYEDLERTLEQLAKKQRRWERAMRDSKRVGESFGKMSANIGRLGRRMALGIGAAGAGVFALASSTASYGDQVAKTAGKLGIGIEALQEHRYAAERSGISVETFDSSLTAMQKRLGEAAKGTGAAKKVLDQLGLSAKDLVKLGPEEALAAIADKMRDIENPAERAAIAAGLFSRSGIGMVNMLGNGSDALQQLRDDARRTGYVLSEEAARDAEAFADAQLDAQLVIKGLKNTIGTELMPVVTRSMKQFSAWAVANREDVAAFAETAATKIEAALPVVGQIVEGMARVSSEIGGVIATVADMVGGWENFGIVIGGVLAAKTIGSVLGFAMSVGRLGLSLFALSGAFPAVISGVKLIGAALVANPIGLAVAAIAGAAVLIYQNWETVGPWFGELWGGVKETFQGIGEFVGGVWRGDWDAVAGGLTKSWGGVKTFYSTLWDGVGAVFKATWENVIKPVTDALGATDTITAAWEGVKTSLKAVLDWMGEKFDWLMGKLQPVLDGLTWLRDKGSGAVDGIKGIGSSIGGWFGGEEDEPEIAPGRGSPRHISGSFLGGDIGRGFRRVGENGPETIWNSKGAYVAHAGATERLSRMAERARPMMAALGGGLRNAMSRAQAAAAPVFEQIQRPSVETRPEGQGQTAAAGQPSQVVQHIQIVAAQFSVAQIAEEIERRGRAAQSGALFDEPHGYGQYEGA